MSKRGGFQGGMPGNMNNLMKQAQRMQRQMEAKTAELEEQTYEATSGGGVVTVTVSGKHEIMSIKMDKDVVDPEDIETLEDLIVTAANSALKKVDDANSQAMASLTGGMNLPF